MKTPEIKDQKHYVYKITNLKNNKIYIGVTYKTLQERFREHVKVAFSNQSKRQPINYAIAKHGKESFIIEVLEEFENGHLAYTAEIEYIKKYNSRDNETGYNISCGGDCGPLILKYTDEMICEMINNHCNGMSMNELSYQYNIGIWSIWDIMRGRYSKLYNIPQELLDKLSEYKKNYIWKPKIDKQFLLNIINDYLDDFTMQEIADKYNICINTVYNVLRRKTNTHIDVDNNLLLKLEEKFKITGKNKRLNNQA